MCNWLSVTVPKVVVSVMISRVPVAPTVAPAVLVIPTSTLCLVPSAVVMDVEPPAATDCKPTEKVCKTPVKVSSTLNTAPVAVFVVVMMGFAELVFATSAIMPLIWELVPPSAGERLG